MPESSTSLLFVSVVDKRHDILTLELKHHLTQALRVKEGGRKQVASHIPGVSKSITEVPAQGSKDECIGEEECPAQSNETSIDSSHAKFHNPTDEDNGVNCGNESTH